MDTFTRLLDELAAAALDHRRAGRDCCAQQLEQVWVRLAREVAAAADLGADPAQVPT